LRKFDPDFARPGTSVGEQSDREPEQKYDIDTRRLKEEDRPEAVEMNKKQQTIRKRLAAVRAAGKYEQAALLRDTVPGGRSVPSETIREARGVQYPALRSGGKFGERGGENYAQRPTPPTGPGPMFIMPPPRRT